ncbi:MAG: Na/Pi cotransporter family protein [Clostridiales bacterium]|nr:Na/Pi cotransporter family protein [Clostridiales bacterium]
MYYVKIVMMILGGMGTLLIGMRMLSDNLTKLAHAKLKNLLGKTARNRFACVGMGAAVTVIAQNSGFTTVMVVGLVNAGIMSLFQATAMIMGANIGTTLAAWLIALGSSAGAGLSFTIFFLAFASIGAFVTIFAKSDKIKTLGNALAGFGLLFVGLSVMSGALSFEPGSSEYNAIFEFFKGLNTPFAPIIFLLVGIAVTALIQSSTAVNTIVITMAAAGLFSGMGGNTLFFIVIGSNIGTCVTALLSSMGANANAKRAALIHFMFNFFGAVLFMIIMLSWKGFAETLIVPAFPGNTEFQITLFHTLFNVICTALFLPFINLFVKLSNFVVRGEKKKKPDEAEKAIIAELDERLLRSPSVALEHLYQGTGKLLTYAMDTLTGSFEAFLEKDVSAKEKVLEQNTHLASVNRSMVEYLVKLSATDLVIEEEKTVSNLHYVLNDIMRLGALADNVTKYTSHYVNDDLVFSDEFLDSTKEMYEKIKRLYALSLETFLNKDHSGLKEVDELEDEIDRDRRRLGAAHIERLNEGKCQPQNSNVYINLVGNLERAADHITFIAHSIENK